MPSLDQPDAAVGEEFAAGLGTHADERVIQSLKDQRRHGDVLHPVGTSNLAMVVAYAREAAISCDKLLVELPQGANLVETVCGIETRVEFDLVAKVLEQVGEKPEKQVPSNGIADEGEAANEVRTG